MDVSEQKKELRKKIREINRSLTEEYKKEASSKICQKVIALEEYQKAETIFCFVGVGSEPDTRDILEDAIRQGKCVSVPLCLDESTMEAVRITDYDRDLETGAYGLLEPKKELPRVDRSEIRFAVIPCVSCDRAGNRLGHGKGYYDRYLEDSGFQKVMLCFEKVLSEEGEIPVGPYDLPVKTVITDD